MSKSTLFELFSPIADLIASQPITADLQYKLENTYPLSHPNIQMIKKLCQEGIRDGWIQMRGKPALQFCNLHRQNAQSSIRIDMVDMTGVGPGHTHLSGEANLCFATEGRPSFDGLLEGWVVKPPNSWHQPTVTGGRMLIIYFIPNGQIQFD